MGEGAGKSGVLLAVWEEIVLVYPCVSQLSYSD